MLLISIDLDFKNKKTKRRWYVITIFVVLG